MSQEKEPKIFKRIDQPYLSQKLVRDYCMLTMRYLFYSSVKTYHTENIPTDKPFFVLPLNFAAPKMAVFIG